ncbi:MAG TPA: biopolymer transporter ExbD [Hyphomonadaceae bacterium]|nr:biopolymer transporter ExbD [Hyphomonadaceae bacterium]
MKAIWLAGALALAACGAAKPDFVANEKTISIAIASDGKITWNGEQVSMEEVKRRLKLEASRSPQPEVNVAPDKLAHYKDVSDVMFEVQSAGLAKRGMAGGA